jgi:hypothetical protein
MNKNKQNSKSFCGFSVKELIQIASLILALLLGVIVGNMVYNNPKDIEIDYSIVDQYKAIRQQTIDEYNTLLDVQKLGTVVNVGKLEAYYNKYKKFEIDYSGWDAKPLAIKLRQRLDYQNKMLIINVNKINTAIKNNTKVDYNSLKITNNIKDDNEIKPIINQCAKDVWQELKSLRKIMVGFYVFAISFIILQCAIDVVERFFS